MEQIHTFLLQAIAGESAAEIKYGACARKAMEEGYVKIADMFLALSKAEAIHSANHQRALQKNGYEGSIPAPEQPGSIGTTRENLEGAIASEKEEFKNMYPSFRRQIRRAYGEDFNAKIALLSMSWASESEAGHFSLLQKALEALDRGEDFSGGGFYLCAVCGNIHLGSEQPEELCQVCGHDPSFFNRVQVEK